MLKNLAILIFMVIAAAANANAQKTADKNADETMIRVQVAQLMKGWNTKSGAEFAKPFAEDADYVVINGMQLKGRTEIDKSHQYIFDTIYKNSTMSLAADSIRFLRSDVAIVHVSAAMQLMNGNAPTTSNARITLVMTKTGGRWEIAAFQNTQVAAKEAQGK